MGKEKLKISVEREAYVRPEIGYILLEEACMVFTSLITHETEPVVPIYEEGGDGVTIPDAPKGAKSYDVWEIELPDNEVDFTFRFKDE